MVFVILSIVSQQTVRAESLEEIEKQMADLQNQMELSIKATTPLEGEVSKLKQQLAGLQSQISDLGVKLKDLETGIKERDNKIKSQYVILAAKVRDLYKKNSQNSPFLIFASSSSAAELTRGLAYKSAASDEDKDLIVSITKDIMKLEEDKKKIQSDKTRLAGLQTKMDTQKAFFEKEIAGAKKWQSELSSKIAVLSAKQQSILAARSGSFITSVGSVPVGSDFDASIAGFNEGAPSGSFGVFSFGAYTHRNGMSQYGAKKLAESKNYREIIKWYYGKEVKKDDGMPDTINVSGYGEMDFQKYMYGIAEMPSDWPMEALKAQAIAARTYAKKAGKPICTSESCQVFLKSKSDNPPASWKQAVDETRKEIIDGDVSSQYSSTAGGYLNTSGWDTTDRSGGGDWTSRALESQAGSPWFYKAWYRNGYKNSDNSCGRKPWLSEEEMSDIINAWLILKKGEGNGADTSRVLPVTIGSCSVGGQGGDPYSIADLRSKTNNPITSISGKPVLSNNGSGSTTNVRFMTNRGEINIPGLEFKEVFNTRAPGYISIPQKGFAFFNIERK
jgi:peptidoglycan hydrolase CwlO-like protein